MSVNGVRGEVSLNVGGKAYPICLTLGALAEIETGLGCDNLKELDIRMRNLSASDLVTVLRALLSGGGAEDIAANLKQTDIQPATAATAVAQAFKLALAV
ncbi:MAG: GTA-gp10 family protein [Pseudomonadota bacterium]